MDRMAELPAPLFCLELAYSLDDKNTVERYLTEYPEETEKCIPIALRQILECMELPAVPFFSKKKLIKYLSVLWEYENVNIRLMRAAGRGLTYLIPYFLNRGADIHTDNDIALRWAAGNGHNDIVRLLLDRKANIHAESDQTLRCAVVSNQIETVRLLLDRKADIHSNNDLALRNARSNGYTNILNPLLSSNADPTVIR